MKIHHIINSYETDAGGAEKLVRNIHKYLIKNKINIEWLENPYIELSPVEWNTPQAHNQNNLDIILDSGSSKEGEKIYLKNIGEIIENPENDKSYKEIFSNSWIYNTSCRFQTESINGTTFKLKSFGIGAQISNQFNSQWGWNFINAFQYNKVENPTIRNYELRDEPNFSSRGVIHRKGIINLDAGYEWQSGQFNSQTFISLLIETLGLRRISPIF